ncbi:hypothetical protein B296_00008176 [Ensete ventricosum]|uniref:Protein kinase domain-containing protein n=1 Tax=Ensete ventricosum TaxID=4639 RepID=A0A427BBB1_ENSVE|nr:hypothetical protein B296_00008176 [Ensete ventricosum]
MVTVTICFKPGLTADLWTIYSHRILGTPNEEIWPGVTSLPDFKSAFPKWLPKDLTTVVPNVEAAGIDLLSERFAFVSQLMWPISNLLITIFGSQKMLHLDPSKRITARQALEHDYFKDLGLMP